MAEEQTRIQQLKARRYTVQNRLSSVNTRLKRANLSAEKLAMYHARKADLLAERDRLAAEIEVLS